MPPCFSIPMRTCMRPRPWLQSQSRVQHRSALRPYSSSQAKAKRPNRFADKTMSLDSFLQRSRALSLYRSIVRGCRKIPDPNTKSEMLHFAREEFSRNSRVTDATKIRYLMSTGKTQWEQMERYIDGL